GKGLSGGQKQLVAFTRLVLSRPRILLLDEPTASMDDALEQRCLRVLHGEEFAGCTLVVVTHKPALLALVSRLVVVAGGRVVMDGPKNEVLARLQQPQTPAPEASQTEAPIPMQPVPAAAFYGAGRML
ncbi:MAG: ATP-binding cassette domain-containing protein, partial [Deltaproteobacteria bacterium]|nr:ATP-binding cassette domain-containing protein [Deltaproteobacteria bacterium]